MKRMYVIPTNSVVQLNIKQHLLIASQTGSGGEVSSFDVKEIAHDNSRKNIWDEEW